MDRAVNRIRSTVRRKPLLVLATLAALVVLLVLALHYAGRARGPGAIDDKRMLNAADEPENWMVNGGTFSGTHYSGLTQIDQANITSLQPAWSFDFDTVRSQQSQPLVVDGVMYVTTAWSKVYAVDAASGRQLWRFDPKVPGARAAMACCDVSNRGAAVYKGKVYFASLDGRLFALDAATGKPVWTTMTVPDNGSYTITGAPRVMQGKVIIGNAGADLGARGYVTAYDSETGKQVWRFYLVPGKPGQSDNAASDSVMESLVRPTWSGDYWKHGGGGTAWHAITYDPEFGRVYIGTGNGSPWNPAIRTDRKGDNLFVASIVALDVDTGKYAWHYQENPQEAWDYNSAMGMILTDLKINGQTRKVLLHAPKNGFFYVIDRATGKIISADAYVPVSWASGIDLKTGRPIEVPGARYENGPAMVSPATSGAHNWHPMAFSPKTGLVYLNVEENGFEFAPVPVDQSNPYNQQTGVRQDGKSLPSKAFLLAWDPARRKEVWRVPVKGGGVMATAGGLVFQGRGNSRGGELVAFDASSGRQVWSFKTPNGIEAGPITYSVKGIQYVAVAGGVRIRGRADAPVAAMPQPGRILVFRLNGEAKFPAAPVDAPPLVQVDQAFSAASINRGSALYQQNCARCHGFSAASAHIVPDLRRSQLLPDASAWKMVVHDGALEANGMIGWSRWLTVGDVEDVRAYVAAQAATALRGQAARQIGTDQ